MTSKFSGLQAMRQERRQQAEQGKSSQPDKVELSIQQARRVGRPNGKRSDPNYQQVTLLLHRETYLAARRRLIEQKRDVSDVLNELLADWLKS